MNSGKRGDVHHQAAAKPVDSGKTVSPSSSVPAPVAQGVTEEVDRLRQEVREAKDQYLRTLAEVENTKKRLQREKEAMVKFAAETLIRELLPIVDSLDHALVAVDKQSDPQAIIKGVHLIYRQLLGLLAKEGVKRIATIGQPFDPHRHEAVGYVDAQHGQPNDTVVEEVQIGYTMHDQVIRPAIVKVARAPMDQKSAVGNQQSDQNAEDNNQTPKT